MNFRKGCFLAFSIFFLNLPLPETLEAVSQASSLPIAGNFEIFKDEEKNLPTVNFSPGEKIFVSIRTQSSGQKEKSLKLLNENKEEIGQWPLLVDHEIGDYFYSLSLTAPSTAGIYYLKVKIDSGQGTVFSGERNINVGKNGHVSVSGQSQNIVQPEQTPPEAETKVKEEVFQKNNFWQNLRDFLKKILLLFWR